MQITPWHACSLYLVEGTTSQITPWPVMSLPNCLLKCLVGLLVRQQPFIRQFGHIAGLLRTCAMIMVYVPCWLTRMLCCTLPWPGAGQSNRVTKLCLVFSGETSQVHADSSDTLKCEDWFADWSREVSFPLCVQPNLLSEWPLFVF